MGTITLPNFRTTADVTMNTRLKDGGVFIDWAGLSTIKAWLYSDAQKAIAGRCDVSIDQTDSTKLVCEYSATKPQYLGVQRLIIQAKYMGRTKTYDKAVFNFVPRTDDQEGTQIVIDDPEVDVEIEVEDISSSLIERLLAACIKATEEAQEVVDTSRGPRGFSAYEVAVQNGFEGTEEEWLLSLQGKSAYEIAVELGYEGTEEQWIASLKGEDGDPGTTPHIGQNGNWFIGDVDTGVAAGGQNGVTPHIGQNGNWFIGDTDTGVLARGTNGVTPHIGDNGHWFIGDTDTNVVAEGQDGNPGITPHIGANNHWFIGETDTGILAEGTDGVTPAISIGTVTTVEPGTPAAASMSGTSEAPVLNLSIPKGLVGATPNITVGTVTTGEPGTPVVVTLTGTAAAPVLNIQIPQGMQGNTGSSVDYPYELVNNLTTNDATKGLSAQQGKVLKDELSQLEAEVTTRATSVSDADYTIRATTGSSSLTDNPSGTRVRIVFPVTAGDVIRLSSTFPSGYSCGIWDTPAHCVNAGSTGIMQVLVDGYTTEPITAISNYTAYLGVSFSNGNTAIGDDLFQRILDSLTVFVGGDVKADINTLQKVDAVQTADISEIKGDVYASPIVTNTTTDNIAVTAYSDKTSGPLEDTKQVMPAGAKLTKVKMFSTGSTNNNGKTHLLVYDENRTKVGDYVLGNIGTTDTEFDVSAHNIIIREGYHYALDRMGNKYTTAIPDGRFKVAPTGANATSKYFYGWTFSYEVPQTKVDELKADYPYLFNRKVVVDNPLYDVVYSGYNNGNALEDKWQDLPVGAKITKVHLGSTGSTGGNPSYLYIYDSNLAQVGERLKLGTIGTTATTFDISDQNIIVQSGYHYCIQYFPRIAAGNNINSGRYFAPASNSNPLSTYQVGFSFSYEYERPGADTIPETSIKGKYGSFIGDSICEGAGYKGGYALLVARKYGMKPPQNLGSSGAIIATNPNENRVYINTMVAKVDPEADFVIIQGGSNDASISTPMGAISEGFTAELDVTTYYGALENLCKTLVTQCAGKKIGYIARHRNSVNDKFSYTWLPKETNYYDPAIAVCEKWGVPYLDLNRHCPPLGCISSLRDAYTANGDGSHPNEDGYNKYYVDRIAAWMQTL